MSERDHPVSIPDQREVPPNLRQGGSESAFKCFGEGARSVGDVTEGANAMSEDRHTRQAPEAALTLNGGEPPGGGYCGFCGIDLASAAIPAQRLGVPFCNEAHAEAFATEVRAARVSAVANAPERSTGLGQGGGEGARAGTRPWSLKRLAKLAACCGAPLVALVILAGGGGALLGAGAAVLPYLALLACPLAMFFMMRAMQGHGEKNESRAHSTPSEDDKER